MTNTTGKQPSTKAIFLDDLIAGIQESILSTQQVAEKQHIETVDAFFDDDTDEPVSMNLGIPLSGDTKKMESVKVPLICLAPMNSIKISDFKMKFKAKLDIETEAQSALSEQIKSDEGLKTPGLTVDFDSSGKPEDMAEIEITFQASDPPKSLVKISDRLAKSINYTPSDVSPSDISSNEK